MTDECLVFAVFFCWCYSLFGRNVFVGGFSCICVIKSSLIQKEKNRRIVDRIKNKRLNLEQINRAGVCI